MGDGDRRLRYNAVMSSAVATSSISGFFQELKEIEDGYHAEVVQLKRQQRDALRKIELENERKEVESMKKRVQTRLYGT
jgi:hypothetical protein